MVKRGPLEQNKVLVNYLMWFSGGVLQAGTDAENVGNGCILGGSKVGGSWRESLKNNIPDSQQGNFWDTLI